jgi:predicted nuclease of predicted toxin-antitoxin system
LRLLVDQDVYAATEQCLRAAPHEVMRVAAVLGATTDDATILAYARTERLVLVTRDLDFGRLAHAAPSPGIAIAILRIGKADLELVHEELLAVLRSHTLDELLGSVVIVEAGRHRVRRLRG